VVIRTLLALFFIPIAIAVVVALPRVLGAGDEPGVEVIQVRTGGAAEVAYLDGVLYEAEDRGDMSGFYRYPPTRQAPVTPSPWSG
jgi:hypothetical protein